MAGAGMNSDAADLPLSAALRPRLIPLQVDDELLLLDLPNSRIVRLDATATRGLSTGVDALTDPLDGPGLTAAPSRREFLTTTGLATLGISILALPTAASAASHTPTLERTAAGSFDDAFDPATNSLVEALAVQSDGKILIGGLFTTVSGQPRNRIARINADGTLDTEFDANVSGTFDYVTSIIVQSDGKILFGGEITTVGGISRGNIARVNADGTLDGGFNPNANNIVNALVLQSDGRIVLGGSFSMVGGQPRNRIARVNTDGTLDDGFNPNANGTVRALAAQTGGQILLGGAFTTVSGESRNRIARVNADGTLDTGFNPDADGAVRSFAVPLNGKIVVGGAFTTVAGQTRNRVARLNADGTLDPGFDPNANGEVLCLLVERDGRIVLGGSFTSVAGQTRNRIARVNADGTLDPEFDASVFNGDIRALLVPSEGKIVIGGNFTAIANPLRGRGGIAQII
jgi:uncharacterized delta-60 repeat protein